VSSRETHCLLKISTFLFAALTHLNEGLSLEKPLAVNVEKYLMCLVGTRRPTVFIKEQQSILFLITIIIIIIITDLNE
jgi:hypothetical protein